ncbi:MAG TPA: glycosyltransferase, partial [Oscillatoriaceae cyanobacterium]
FHHPREIAPLALPVGEGPVVGVVSHLIPWKGQDVFVRAAARLAPDHPDWRFVVVGDDIFQFRGERTRLEALAASLGIGERIAFVGHREDVPGVLEQFDLFVLPSLYEPFGRVLIEAMAATRPIVATFAGGVPEIVLDGETGVLVPPGDDERLAQAIAAVLADSALAKRLATAARQRVETHFALTRTVEGVMQAYGDWGLTAP